MNHEPPLTVREAGGRDIDSIIRVQARTMVASSHYPDAVNEDAVYGHLESRVSGYFTGTYGPKHALPERILFVAEIADAVVGFCAGHRTTRMGCTGELEWMFVHPDYQRRGVGGRLIQPMREWFVSQQATRVIVDAPPRNPYRGFYIKHGARPLDSYWLYWEDIGTQTGAMQE